MCSDQREIFIIAHRWNYNSNKNYYSSARHLQNGRIRKVLNPAKERTGQKQRVSLDVFALGNRLYRNHVQGRHCAD